jgi:hypothetical protein
MTTPEPNTPPLQAVLDRILASPARDGEIGRFERLLRLREGAPFALQTLAELAAADQDLANRLRLASRRHDSDGPRLITIREALREGGFRAVHCVAIVCSLAGVVGERMRASSHAAWWRDAVRTAIVSQIIAEGWQAHVDHAFAAGLVANIADLALQTHAPELWPPPAGGDEAERAAWGFARRDVAVALVRHWGFPEHVIEATALAPCTCGAAAAPLPLGELIDCARKLGPRSVESGGEAVSLRELFAEEPAFRVSLGGRSLGWLHARTELILETAMIDQASVTALVA